MTIVEYSNTNVYYIGGKPNAVLGGKLVDDANKQKVLAVETGWHIVPNSVYNNFLTPRQWFDLVTNHSAFAVHSVEAICQNLIPLTDNLSINQDTTFLSFNNTVYALGYQDNLYETIPYTVDQQLIWREGVTLTQLTYNDNPTVSGKNYLPMYSHFIPTLAKSTTEWDVFGAFGWDPMVNATSLSELRPGKNAISFTWKAEETHWGSTSIFYAATKEGDGSNRPVQDDFSSYNYYGSVITPHSYNKADPRAAYYQGRRTVFMHHGIYGKPIPNWFLKMLPIHGKNNAQLNIEGQIVISKKIRFQVKPRGSASNYPQLDYYWLNLDRYKMSLVKQQNIKGQMKLALQPPDLIGLPPWMFYDEAQKAVTEDMEVSARDFKTAMSSQKGMHKIRHHHEGTVTPEQP